MELSTYILKREVNKMYQPKTGNKCGCKRGIERDNCPACEGTGQQIDFKKVREMPTVKEVLDLDNEKIIDFINSTKAKDFFDMLKWPEGYVYSSRSPRYCQITLRQVLSKLLENREVLS
jgi:hypothetical protein